MNEMFNKKEKIEYSCCFTGHRKIQINKNLLTDVLRIEMEKMILNGVRYFYCGGAMGFDIIAGKKVVELRQKYPNVKLIIAVPCREQSKSFDYNSKLDYDYIISEADEVICLSEHYYRGCMHARNRYMVDNSAYCICYLTENKGGTFYTVNYAKRKNLKIINLAEIE